MVVFKFEHLRFNANRDFSEQNRKQKVTRLKVTSKAKIP